jgi:hypothetical protein
VTDLNRLLQRLCDAEIEFIIVGGFAAMLHGSTLLTRDLDVCAVLSATNVERLRDILRLLRIGRFVLGPSHSGSRRPAISIRKQRERVCH